MNLCSAFRAGAACSARPYLSLHRTSFNPVIVHTPTLHLRYNSQRSSESAGSESRPRDKPINAQEIENTNVHHSRFISEASPQTTWKGGFGSSKSKKGLETSESEDDLADVQKGRGKLSPTSSHLFKLILPLGQLSSQWEASNDSPGTPPPKGSSSGSHVPPTVFLLHPSQPLSHVSRLVLASLAPSTPNISFRSKSRAGRAFQWSDATDVGDFVRDAAAAQEFTIHISEPESTPAVSGQREHVQDTVLTVEVPSFTDRTRFLRRRLDVITKDLKGMEELKQQCDHEAHMGARRLAVGGFGILVCYWGVVARLTFWDLGWDVMEPVTYLSGLTMVILGYLWFLYQGREVSYSSLLHHSISARRDTLYRSHGFDIDRWTDLAQEARSVRREIRKIAQDYDDQKQQAAMDAESKGRQDDEDVSASADDDEQLEGDIEEGIPLDEEKAEQAKKKRTADEGRQSSSADEVLKQS